jgi:hypothetical protein
LAGRVAFVKGAKLEGQVFLNGAAIDYALMPKICGALENCGDQTGVYYIHTYY